MIVHRRVIKFTDTHLYTWVERGTVRAKCLAQDTTQCPRPGLEPGARFSKAPETFRARKAVFSSSVSENGEVYTPETSCVKRTSVYIKNT